MPWYAEINPRLPLECDGGDLASATAALEQGLAAAGVRLLDIRCRAIGEAEFNRLLGEHDSKGALLSRATLQLVVSALDGISQGPVLVLCDKHGGRDRYAALLDRSLPGVFIEICGESRQLSVYRFGPPKRRVEIRFQTRAEAHLPTALASMSAKYLRELAMLALNDFWAQRLPGLRRTAGYPEDAKRFKADIAAVQAELGIPDFALWRVR